MGMGYPDGLLQCRSIIKKNNYAVITPDGRVKNVVPGFEWCEMTILGNPKIGVGYVDYIVKMLPSGKNEKGFGGDGIETFIYCIKGALTVTAGDETYELTDGSTR